MRVWFTLLLVVVHQSLKGEETFLLIRGSTSEIMKEMGPHINERITPACSFNIALSLMGYDALVLYNEYQPIYEFQEGYDEALESWKVSQTPQTWMTRSCVWFSKLIALQLGFERIQRYLTLFEYGNQDLSTGMVQPGPNNPPWVSGSLKISPKEQVDFIQKMLHDRLPISNHALQMTKTILFKETLSNEWKLYGKTGLGSENHLQVRWFVGWVENQHTFFPFAYQMREKEIDVTQTIPRVKQLLEESNVMRAGG